MAVLKPNIPHFSLPFRIVDDSAAVVEQDSLDEHVDCIFAILSYPLGFRSDSPDFGVTDQVFRQSRAAVEEFTTAIRLWEPRADTLINAEPDLIDSTIERVKVEVRGIPDG